jgi:hypothetical protein
LDHFKAIRQYIDAMTASSEYHLVIVEGSPGFGKSTTVEQALSAGGFLTARLPSYCTSLVLFNFMFENSKSTIVIDDAAGVFSDQSSMAILKAATWPQADNKRMVRWGSTSGRALATEFEFRGKFVVICNSFPVTPDGEAIKSRGFNWKIEISEVEARGLLAQAALDSKRFPISNIAVDVARYLCDRINHDNVSKINFRTLGKGYELAKLHPENWQALLSPMIPDEVSDPLKLVKELDRQGLKVKEQAVIFERRTKLKVRSFYKYRAAAGLSR